MAAVTEDVLDKKLEANNATLVELINGKIGGRIGTLEEQVHSLEIEVKENSSLAHFADHAIYAETKSYERNVLILGIAKTKLTGDNLKEHDNKLAFNTLTTVVKGYKFGWTFTSFHIDQVIRLKTRPYKGNATTAPKFANCDKLRVVLLNPDVASTVLKCARLYSEDPDKEPEINIVREISQSKRDYLDYCHEQKNRLNADPSGNKWHSVVDDYIKPGRLRRSDEEPKPMRSPRGRRGGRGGNRRGRQFGGAGAGFFPHNFEFGNNGDPSGPRGGSNSGGGSGDDFGGTGTGENNWDMRNNQTIDLENSTQQLQPQFQSNFARVIERRHSLQRGRRRNSIPTANLDQQQNYFTLSPSSRATASVATRREIFEVPKKNQYKPLTLSTVNTPKRSANDMSPENSTNFNNGPSKSLAVEVSPDGEKETNAESPTHRSTPINSPVKTPINRELFHGDSQPLINFGTTAITIPLPNAKSNDGNEEDDDISSDGSVQEPTVLENPSATNVDPNNAKQSEIQPEENYSLCPPSQMVSGESDNDGEDEIDFLKNGKPIRSVLGENKLLPNELYDLWLEKYHTIKQKQATCKEDMFTQLVEDGELLHFLVYIYEDTEYSNCLEEWCISLKEMIRPLFKISTVNTQGYDFNLFTERCQELRHGSRKPIMYSALLHGSFLTRQRNYLMSRTKSAKAKQKMRKSLNRQLDSSILLKDGNLVFSPAKY